MRSPHRIVADVARPGITAVQAVFDTVPSASIRVAALIEISSAAAALARTLTNRYNIATCDLISQVNDPIDMYAVLGYCQWIPTMTRSVTVAKSEPLCVGEVLPATVPDRPFTGKEAGDAAD